MHKIFRRIRRLHSKRKLYRRYGHRMRADFRSSGRVFRLPDNTRRREITAADLEKRLARRDDTE